MKQSQPSKEKPPRSPLMSGGINRVLLLVSATLLSLTSAKAGTATFTFDTDPRNDPQFIITSNVLDSNTGLDFYEATNGDPGGYIAITRAVGSQASQILFPDFDKGLVVKAFTFECDLRLVLSQNSVAALSPKGLGGVEL
jgi:hypothetical protein